MSSALELPQRLPIAGLTKMSTRRRKSRLTNGNGSRNLNNFQSRYFAQYKAGRHSDSIECFAYSVVLSRRSTPRMADVTIATAANPAMTDHDP